MRMSEFGQVLPSANDCLGVVTLTLTPDAVCRVGNSLQADNRSSH